MKIRHFGLFFVVLAVILISCHVPGAPGGDTFREAEQPETPEIPDNNENSVVNQLARLQQTALDNGDYYIDAKSDETIYLTQLISFLGRQDITVTIQSYGKIRRVLSTGSDVTMFQVQNNNVRLILRNIILQGHIGNNNPMVIVNPDATLEMNNDSVIRGNSGHGVSVNGGVFYMKGNASVTAISTEGVYANNGSSINMYGDAQIHHNSGGLFLEDSTLTMNENARVHNNQKNGGVFLTGAAAGLFMHGDSLIQYNRIFGTSGFNAGGVTAQQGSSIFMYGNARMHDNRNYSISGGGGAVTLLSGASLNMHSDGVRIGGQNFSDNSGGGGVWMQDSILKISGGSISGNPGATFSNRTLHLQGPGNFAWAGTYILGVFTPVGPSRPSSITDILVSSNGGISGVWAGLPL